MGTVSSITNWLTRVHYPRPRRYINQPDPLRPGSSSTCQRPPRNHSFPFSEVPSPSWRRWIRDRSRGALSNSNGTPAAPAEIIWITNWPLTYEATGGELHAGGLDGVVLLDR